MSHTSESADRPAADLRTGPTFACRWTSDCARSGWLHLEGELDLATVPRFRTALQESLMETGTVSIDLRGLSFIDCSALKVIVDADARAREEGNRMILVRGGGQVDRVLELTGLLDLLETVDLQLSGIPAEGRGRRTAGA